MSKNENNTTNPIGVSRLHSAPRDTPKVPISALLITGFRKVPSIFPWLVGAGATPKFPKSPQNPALFDLLILCVKVI